MNVTAAYLIVYNHWWLCQKPPWFKRLTVIGLDSNTLWLSTCLFSMRIKWKHGQQIVWHFNFRTRNCFFMPPRRRVGWHINLPPVRTSVRPSGYRYMLCPAISSYSFGATALIFCMMFIHIMEVCMSTGFWFSSNILKMTGVWTFIRTSCIKGTWFVRLTPTVLELQL